MYRKIIEKLQDKNVAILGFGKEGISTYKFIRRYSNQKLTIIDKNKNLKENNEFLNEDENLEFILGDNYLENLDKYDYIIKSPGISFKDIDKDKIQDKITSQLELLLEVNKDNVIGVTATKGKSTTSSLIYEVFKANNKPCFLLGNIGNPILNEIEKYDDKTTLIIEMSSHQLEFIKVSPHVGIILNLFEDHLDHAGTIEHYHECKLNMFKYQDETDISIYCSDNENLKKYMNKNDYKGIKYSVNLKEKASIYLEGNDVISNGKVIYDINQKRNLLGNHNLENIMVTLLVSELFNLDLNNTVTAINNFKNLPHRMELVGTYNDIIYYDDAISTVPTSTINAIEALKSVDTLIFGGMDRKIDYSQFIEYLIDCYVRNLICMPKTGYTIGNVLKEETDKNIYFAESLEDAVEIAKKVTKKGHICLLSPAASSYEYFKNFEEKGNTYQKLIKR